jgi:ferritin
MLVKSLLSKPIEAMLNEAVQSELYASHLYKHVANQLQRIGYFGAQKFFAGESADELTHYQRHADFLNDRGTVAKVPMLEAITDPVASLRDALEVAYETELQLGKDYDRWYKASSDDPTVQQYLLQFLEIQRKSVGEYGDLLARMDRAGTNEAAILMIDTELGEG